MEQADMQAENNLFQDAATKQKIEENNSNFKERENSFEDKREGYSVDVNKVKEQMGKGISGIVNDPTKDLLFSTQLFINSLNFRENLDDTISFGKNFAEGMKKNDSPEQIEQSYDDFRKRMTKIHSNVSEILQDKNLNPLDHRNAIELQSVLSNVLENISADNTRNNHIVNLTNKLADEIKDNVEKRDEFGNLIEDADNEQKRRHENPEKIRELLEKKNDISLDDNELLQSARRYSEWAEQLANKDFKRELAYYRAKRDSNPGAIMAMIELDRHLFGENAQVEHLVNRQLSINKEKVKNMNLIQRMEYHMDLSIAARKSIFREAMEVNPLGMPIKLLMTAYDMTDQYRYNELEAKNKIQVNNFIAKSELLAKSGQELGRSAIEQQIKNIKSQDVSPEEAQRIHKQLTDRFNSIGNMSLITIRSIYDDARKGKISPILTEKVESVKDFVQDVNPKNIRERRKLRPN